jgi:hypothetical protein
MFKRVCKNNTSRRTRRESQSVSARRTMFKSDRQDVLAGFGSGSGGGVRWGARKLSSTTKSIISSNDQDDIVWLPANETFTHGLVKVLAACTGELEFLF